MTRAVAMLILVVVACAAAEPLTRLPIPNGGMDAGTEAPEGWKVRWTGKGMLKAFRDTSVFHGGPASLRLDTVGLTHASGGCIMPCLEGTTVGVSARFKTTERCKAKLFIQLYRDDWTYMKPTILAIHDPAAGPFWSEGHGTVAIPPGFTHLSIGLFVDGEGSAWLDDVVNLVDAPASPVGGPGR